MTTDNKTLAVDVLAVMDGACYVLLRKGSRSPELEEARSVVAELIEAGKAIQTASDEIEAAKDEYLPVLVPMDVQASLNRKLRSARERFSTALARVKGEAA
ncbi:hypothetical protein [Stenotrophomonas muris]|uniref:hypothetical protein n=1 Tax=Stenotrophomonas muris TaxID=2963283 RepID=UPI0031CAA27B|nr:hypothetical protein [Stenotrophomonas maltophilia]